MAIRIRPEHKPVILVIAAQLLALIMMATYVVVDSRAAAPTDAGLQAGARIASSR
jgi:hypothetical protein